MELMKTTCNARIVNPAFANARYNAAKPEDSGYYGPMDISFVLTHYPDNRLIFDAVMKRGNKEKWTRKTFTWDGQDVNALVDWAGALVWDIVEFDVWANPATFLTQKENKWMLDGITPELFTPDKWTMTLRDEKGHYVNLPADALEPVCA